MNAQKSIESSQRMAELKGPVLFCLFRGKRSLQTTVGERRCRARSSAAADQATATVARQHFGWQKVLACEGTFAGAAGADEHDK